ncbi:MAG: malto-oligosyltrehalose trehalohydrolase [Catalinimonas sp.]
MTQPVGSRPVGDAGSTRYRFTVWAPAAKHVLLSLSAPHVRQVEMQRDLVGYWSAEIDGVTPDTRYAYVLDGTRRPDPASRAQPGGVHADSAVVDPHFDWQDDGWQAPDQQDWVIYELHVGTFTPAGTFEAIIGKLDHLRALGANVIELMPISQFPGNRNWGYDGVYPYAAQASYGGAAGLKQLVDACHAAGIAVILDVVYNHMGPEGNYLRDFGPYFTDKHQTPWGEGLNFDDRHADPVRAFFVENALMWLGEFRLDGLRLDAVHAIKDQSARHLLQEISDGTRALEEHTGRRKVLIAECDLNDPRYLAPTAQHGLGMDGQWIDEFHHALHALLTGERLGYYEDFGTLDHLRRTFEGAYVYAGEYSAHRQRLFGADASHLPTHRFVAFAQNHDQVGNRMMGDRLATLVPPEALRLAAAALLLSPYVPMLFMGEEWGETNPFLYFVSHTDPALVQAVREGRAREFAAFQREGHTVPDPQGEATFERSKPDWNFEADAGKKQILAYHRHLLQLRSDHPALGCAPRETMEVRTDPGTDTLFLKRSGGGKTLLCVFNCGEHQRSNIWTEPGTWQRLHASNEVRWGGNGTLPEETLREGDAYFVPPYGVLVYERTAAPGA